MLETEPFQKAEALRQSQDYAAAIEQYSCAYLEGYISPELLVGWGECLAQLGTLNEAKECLDEARQLIAEPSPKILRRLGIAYFNSNQLISAIDCFTAGSRCSDYQDLDLNCDLAVSLFLNDEYDEAIALLRTNIKRAEEHLSSWNNLGFALYEQNQLEEAEQCFQTALKLSPNNPSVLQNYAQVLLKTGRWTEGFRAYQSRFIVEPALRKEKARFDAVAPAWQGEPIGNRHLLVWGEQGYGDQIQFGRFLLTLRERYPVSKLTFLLDKSLVTLFQQFGQFGIEVDSLDRSQEVAADFQVPVMDLTLYLNIQPDNIPWAKGYLKTKPIHLPLEHVNKTKVGVCFSPGLRSNPKSAYDYRKRQISASFFESLLSDQGVVIYSFHAKTEISNQDQRIINLQDQLTDFFVTTRWLTSMDYIITVDTALAHLAGSLGVSCKMFLPNKGSDWRWGHSSKDWNWYQSIHILDKLKGTSQEVPF